uniref:Uncharacterized protein n=1 Tax=Zea mays TaxID=4577 RepID=B6T2H4_MAIZE|nr:hypothetical protein [Zea mays]
MVKDGGVKKVAVAAPAPEEATPTGLTATPTLTVKLPAPEAREKCYKKTVGEDATFLEIAKDYFNQFKEVPAQKHWICFKSYFVQKRGSVFGNRKQKIDPAVKDETPEVVKPAAAAVVP